MRHSRRFTRDTDATSTTSRAKKSGDGARRRTRATAAALKRVAARVKPLPVAGSTVWSLPTVTQKPSSRISTRAVLPRCLGTNTVSPSTISSHGRCCIAKVCPKFSAALAGQRGGCGTAVERASPTRDMRHHIDVGACAARTKPRLAGPQEASAAGCSPAVSHGSVAAPAGMNFSCRFHASDAASASRVRRAALSTAPPTLVDHVLPRLPYRLFARWGALMTPASALATRTTTALPPSTAASSVHRPGQSGRGGPG